jgi:hypothetical protein
MSRPIWTKALKRERILWVPEIDAVVEKGRVTRNPPGAQRRLRRSGHCARA